MISAAIVGFVHLAIAALWELAVRQALGAGKLPAWDERFGGGSCLGAPGLRIGFAVAAACALSVMILPARAAGVPKRTG